MAPASSLPQATSSGNEDKVSSNKHRPPTGQINPARSSVTQKAARLTWLSVRQGLAAPQGQEHRPGGWNVMLCRALLLADFTLIHSIC